MEAQRVETRELVVKDDEGRVVARLGPGRDGGGALTLYDRNGQERIKVEAGQAGVAGFPGTDPTLALLDDQGHASIYLVVMDGDRPYVSLCEHKGDRLLGDDEPECSVELCATADSDVPLLHARKRNAVEATWPTREAAEALTA